MSNRKNLANGILAAPVNDTTTTWTLESGYGAGMPEVPFYITATPFGQLPTQGNSEIVNVTARSGDTLTVTRGAKGTTAKAFDAGAVVANGIYVEDLNNIFLQAHPVGAIYMSVSSVNPGTLFGGTWSAWGSGRVPIGVDTGQSEFDVVEETGGDKNHIAKVNFFASSSNGYVDYATDDFVDLYTEDSRLRTGSGGAAWDNGSRSETNNRTGVPVGGVSDPSNALPPYITCYMWKRTA